MSAQRRYWQGLGLGAGLLCLLAGPGCSTGEGAGETQPPDERAPAEQLEADPETDPETDPEVDPSLATAPDAKAEPPARARLDPQDAFVAVYEALRAGDWEQLEPFTGAASIRLLREASIGELPKEDEAVEGAEAQAWLGRLAATWAPECSETPDPPCRGLNPLSLGVELDELELELRCAAAGPEDRGTLCCSHSPPLLHNTPFLTGLCFDDEQRLTQVSILDG